MGADLLAEQQRASHEATAAASAEVEPTVPSVPAGDCELSGTGTACGPAEESSAAVTASHTRSGKVGTRPLIAATAAALSTGEVEDSTDWVVDILRSSSRAMSKILNDFLSLESIEVRAGGNCTADVVAEGSSRSSSMGLNAVFKCSPVLDVLHESLRSVPTRCCPSFSRCTGWHPRAKQGMLRRGCCRAACRSERADDCSIPWHRAANRAGRRRTSVHLHRPRPPRSGTWLAAPEP